MALASLPWWACLLLAGASYLVFHMFAGIRVGGALPEVIGAAMWRAFGYFGQIVAPLFFILAAIASAARRVARRREQSPQFGSGTTSEAGLGRPPSPWDAHVDAGFEQERDLYEFWKEVSRSESPRPSVDTSRWSVKLLQALDWKRFEHLCAGYFEQLGFKTKVAREGADGGVDIHLYSNGSSEVGIVVQCKAWKTYKVGVKPVRELLGVMTAARVSEGVFVTTGDYTPEARQFAKDANIHLIDGRDLLAKIADRPAADQRALLALATAGDFTTPTCPSCGTKMVEREAQATGDRFWGCTGFPRCRRTFRLSQTP